MEKSRKSPAEIDETALDAVRGGAGESLAPTGVEQQTRATFKEFTVTKKTDASSTF